MAETSNPSIDVSGLVLRIKELEDEVRRLKQDLQVALGKLYDRV